ncbi:MAG: RIP metalloprotease RseP [Lachnospiraceae bacterium]|nr:RIP metalloprotease RseP [Lachnospiraceae bacterium]
MIATILLFILVFGVIVISHEFGHFLLAKANGIHVVEFSVGMGPNIFSFKKGDTKYSIKLLPIGGACMFEGEDGLNAKEGEMSEGAFPNASVWARISTVVAGPLFNFILAFIVSLIMVQFIVIQEPVITEVTQESAAQEAGLLPGDRIISLNGSKVYLYQEVSVFNQMNKGAEVTVVYERDGEKRGTVLTPKFDETYGRYMFGIVNNSYVELKGLDGLKYAWYEVRSGVITTYKSLAMLIQGKVSRTEVAGPVGMANIVGDIYEETKDSPMDVFVNMLNIIMLLSVNLGILNLLPIPALDGGRLVFLLIELVRGKPVPPEKEGIIHFIGFVFFMILMVVVFFNDISNIFFSK